MTKPIALITGATAGIGWATAEELAHDHRLILCGRRKEKLASIKEKLSKITEVETLEFDVRKKEQVFSAIESLPQEWKNISVLLNNAGNAHGLDTFQEANIDDLDAMIDGNVQGIIYVTKAVVGAMIEAKKGHIINISSMAGKETYGKGTVYCASKKAVEALSQGMRIDLGQDNIRVTNIAPGAVETEFSLVRFKGDEKKSDAVYSGYKALEAKDIASAICYAIRQPEHVQIADMTILPNAQRNATTFVKI